MYVVACNHRFEMRLDAACVFDNPLYDVDATISLTSPSGRTLEIDAYWDGAKVWRFAFSPDETGEWRWRCSCPVDEGLDGASGEFLCEACGEDNPLYAHGAVGVSPSGTHLAHADGTPFFWLADTAWNGVLRGGDAAWGEYLRIRRMQGFTAIQFVASHWRGEPCNADGQAAFTEDHPSRINPEFFQCIDRRVAMVNEAGLLAAPVILWSLLETDPGRKIDEEDAIRIARYIVARYGAHQVLWLLGGDGDYHAMGIDRWKRIGRGVFDRPCRRPVTLHPCGLSWVGNDFREEPWYDLIGYQSGHGDGVNDLEWLTKGPPATDWGSEPLKPVINLEPNYEAAIGYTHHEVLSDYHVRRAAYWSLLQAPTAGVTFGHDAIWNWNAEPGPSVGHGGWGNSCVAPWSTALDTPGLASMTVMRRIFDSFPWWTLRPDSGVLASQPCAEDVKRHVVCATSDEGGFSLLYTPMAQELRLANGIVATEWIDPRTGNRSPVKPGEEGYRPPASGDWLLLVQR